MCAQITPEPYLIPGYTGHCPQLMFRQGKTYARLTHQLLTDPCTKHAPELIIAPPTKPASLDYPTEAEVKTLKDRTYRLDAVYKHPVIPGYDGFVPNLTSKIGKRYLAAATAGLAQHEALSERLRCEKRVLQHRDLLASGQGNFKPKLRERMMSKTKYNAPLLPVRPHAQAVKIENCIAKEEKIPYSKFTVPHFMEDDDEQKYIINGYSGHIPTAMMRFGQCSKELSHNALNSFTNSYHQRIRGKWCPHELTQDQSACPKTRDFTIYFQTMGMIPKYAGHVPGQAFKIGQTYADATRDAKGWLDLHRDTED